MGTLYYEIVFGGKYGAVSGYCRRETLVGKREIVRATRQENEWH